MRRIITPYQRAERIKLREAAIQRYSKTLADFLVGTEIFVLDDVVTPLSLTSDSYLKSTGLHINAIVCHEKFPDVKLAITTAIAFADKTVFAGCKIVDLPEAKIRWFPTVSLTMKDRWPDFQL